jgi:hypothetical protein
MGLLEGILGGVSAMGKTAGAYYMDVAIQRERERAEMDKLKAVEDLKEKRLQAKLADPNSPEAVQLRANKAQADSAEVMLSERKEKQAEGLIQSGRDTQLPNGDYVAVGSDGKARRTDSEGNLMDAKGVDAKTWGMDKKELLQIKSLEATIASAGLAAMERTEKQADKKAIREGIDLLTQYVSQESDAPGKYQKQINQQILELRKYGVDVSDMIQGKAKEVGTTSVKSMDSSGNEVTKTTKDVARSGGMISEPNIPKVTSEEEAKKLPKGTIFIGPDGKRYRA